MLVGRRLFVVALNIRLSGPESTAVLLIIPGLIRLVESDIDISVVLSFNRLIWLNSGLILLSAMFYSLLNWIGQMTIHGGNPTKRDANIGKREDWFDLSTGITAFLSAEDKQALWSSLLTLAE